MWFTKSSPSHLLPKRFLLLDLGCVENGSVVLADGQVLLVMLTERDHQLVVLQL